MEKWKVFYHNKNELCAYTLRGEFAGEEDCTKRMLSHEHEININDIMVVIEER